MPYKNHLFSKVSLIQTLTRRTQKYWKHILNESIRFCLLLNKQSHILDESTDICGIAQLVILIRGIDKIFNNTQKMEVLFP